MYYLLLTTLKKHLFNLLGIKQNAIQLFLKVSCSFPLQNTCKFKKAILSFALFLFSVLSHSQTQTFTSSGSFTPPAGVTTVTAGCWGGGGKGGDRTSSNLTTAGGGGGAYSIGTATVIPGTSYTVTVGLGSTTTAAGQDSWFLNATTVMAKGGNSCADNTNVSVSGGLFSSGFGNLNRYSGGNSAFGTTSSFGGGGGSSAGTAANGNFLNTTTNQSAGGAVTGGGSGGAGRSGTQGDGVAGSTPGGGGGGALKTGSGTRLGGNGANGQVIVTYSVPTYSLTSVTATTICPSNIATITLSNITVASLPVGTYTVNYTLGAPNAVTTTATMTVTVAGSGTFTTGALANSGSTSITINSLASGASSLLTPLVSNTLSTGNTGTITVNALPTITVQPATPAASCSGSGSQTMTVTATGAGLTYSWRRNGTAVINGAIISGQGTNTLTLTNPLVADAGNYDVIVSGSCLPAVTSTVRTVIVNALPTPGLTSNDADNIICAGTSVTFTATGGTNYNFRLDGTSVQNSATATYTTTTLTNGQVVDVIVTNASGCVATSSGITTTVNALPTPGLTSNDADNIICAGTSVTFTATGGTSYNFRVNGTSVQNSATATFTTTTLTNGQIVDVIVTNASGCNATSSGITTTVNVLPTPGLTSSDSDNIICAGTSVTFTATGGTNYNFRVNGTSVQSGAAATYTTTALTNGQIVDVIVTNASGCIATSSGITTTVNALPTPGLTNNDADNIICAGTSVTFTATGGTSYNFRVNGTSVQNSATATYTTTALTNGQVVDVIVTNASGCIATSSGISTIVNALPTITVQPATPAATCSGSGSQSMTVTATGTGLTYSWRKDGTPVINGAVFSGQGTNTLTLTNPLVADAGSYDVIVSGSCAPAVTSIGRIVTVNALPTPGLTSNDADNIICAGTLVTFTATGGTNYNFRVNGITVQNSASASYITSALTNGQVVTVIVTNVSGCVATSSGITTTVNALPTPGLTSNDADNIICVGTSVTFTATGGTNYNFRVNGTSVQNSATATYTTTALTNGQIVDVIVTNASGCIATSSGITTTVNALPTPGLTSNDADNIICAGTSVTFTATGGTNYNFRVNGTSVQSGASATYTTTALTNGQVVDVIVTNASGCIATSSGITTTVNALPTPGLTSSDADNIICAGTSVTFTATGGTSYNFRVNGTSVQSGATATYTTTTLTNGQVVTVIVTNALGCIATSSGITTTVNAIPTPGLTSNDADNIICAGTSVTFTATGGTNYNFRLDGTSVQNSATATYTTTALTNGQVIDVIVTNASGCIGTSSGITTTVNALPTPGLTSNDADNIICAGTSVTFTATGGTNYNFRVNGTSVQNSATATFTTTTLTNGQVVTVIVTNASGCIATSSGITTTVNALPTPGLTSSDADNIICAGTSLTFTATGGTSYNFRVNGTSFQNGASATYTTTTLTNGQVVTVIVTNASGCVATSSGITTTVNALPTPGLTSNDADNIICAGTSVTFTATGGTSYNFRVNGTSVQNSTTATYTTTTLTNGQVVDVIVTNALGCIATSSGITTTVNALPTPGLTSSDADNIICAGTSVTFTATGGTSYNFRVNGTSVQSGATATYTTTALTNGQVVTVIVTNALGCIATSSGITTTVNAIPTATAGGSRTICVSGTATVSGATATNGTISWTENGAGSITSGGTTLTPVYTPALADGGNTVTLTLSVTNSPCVTATAVFSVVVLALPTAVAGPNLATCSTYGAINITAGAVATNQSSVTWTSSGSGTFANANSLTNCTYNPSLADISAGSVTLTLTSFGNAPCGNATSTKTLTIFVMPVITGTTPGARTAPGTVLLGATASIGTLNWYNSLTGGTLLGTGTSFTTPFITTTTTFYVEAVNGICNSSPRTPVIATIRYPDIEVQGNAISIPNNDTTPLTTDWTDFGTLNLSRTFTIRNVGNALLTLDTILITGTNASDFSVTTDPASAVGIGTSTTFVITFAPTAVGLRRATVTFVNNDPNENPFSFDIQGTGVQQEIEILGNSVIIANNSTNPTLADWTDFNNVAGTRTFTIRNLGNIALTIGTINITGTNFTDFTVTTPPSSIITGYGLTTFVVSFSPNAINNRTATITIVNNDINENPYIFAIKGFGIIPEIDLQGNAISIPSSIVITPTVTNWTDFGSTTATRTFTIRNLGNIDLTISPVTISGTNMTDFSVITQPILNIEAFASVTFVVRFSPTSTGTKNAIINITNNDGNGDENPYRFNIRGTGTDQAIELRGNNTVIAYNAGSASITTGTDFGGIDINLYTVTRTFTIINTGALPLTIQNPTITGTNAGDFSVTTNPSTLILGAGASTTFSVRFNPTAVFARLAQINIVNNDTRSNRRPFRIVIQGTGLLDNDGDGTEDNADQDDDNDGILDSIECGTCVSTIFTNGSFETPVIPAVNYAILPTSSVPGWQTDNINAENFIEIWSTNYSNMSGGAVPAAAGNQFAELNANIAGTLYQSFCLNGAGGTIDWTIKHRGRGGTDTAFVKFGTTLANSLASTPIVTMESPNDAWFTYNGTYNIPAGQTNIVLTFQAGSTASGDLSVGNFIDDIKIIINQNCIDTDGDTIADLRDVDDDNDGIPDIEEAGFKNLSNGRSTMDRTSPTTWTDTNNNGLNDFIDSRITANTYAIPDNDGDGVPNHLDLDSDNDTVFDVDDGSLLNGDGDITGDGIGDLADTDKDGLLNLYDNSTNFGTIARAYAQDADLNGNPDFLELDSNDDGVNDINTGLYGSFDANNNGIIDGSGDSDNDGILNVFDTNDIVRGSPRDLDRKLFLDFDGRNDYALDTNALGGLTNATMMAWIDLHPTFSATGVVAGVPGFQLRITSGRNLEATVNGTTVTFNTTTLNRSQWYHVAAVYNGSASPPVLSLFLNGVMVRTSSATGTISSSFLTLGKNPSANDSYFKGKIDEVRVFNNALTDAQVQRMVYQEIQNTASQVRGAIVPKDVGALPFTNVLRYYRMDVYKDDIIDNLTTPTIDTATGMEILNHKVINNQQAPMPFTTIRTGDLASAINDPTKDIRGLDATELDYSIIQVKHNITEAANNTDLAMFVDPGVTINMTNDTKIQNDWYLKLDGKIDLVGRSQLVQTINSDLDVTSAGSVERDQFGKTNKFNYNYWSSPVSSINSTTINHGFTIAGVMKDGTTTTPQNLNWTSSVNSTFTSPITISNRWIYKFQNLSNAYANWVYVGSSGSLLAGQGYTMKGSDASTATQNYTFVGKPNNGAITSTVSANNLNLSGNPYPSAIDADQFINDNVTSIKGTLYFWEHYDTNNSHVTVRYQGGYATYTKVGGTAPVAPAGISGLGSSSKTPKRFIPVGQGFFVTGTTTGGTITFNNGQRIFVKEDNTSSYTLFRSNANPTVTAPLANDNSEDNFITEEFMKLRLGYTSTDNYNRQILLGFMDMNATAGYDEGYDGLSIETLTNDMYFINGSNKLNIQGDGYFNINNSYPLGVKNEIAGNVKFSIDDKENFEENQEIYIYDGLNNIYHSIKNQDFEIVLPAGVTENRFSLRFTTSNSLGTNDNELQNEITISHSQSNNVIHIKNEVLDNSIKSVLLFNLIGQKVLNWEIDNPTQRNIELPVTNVSTGAYIVKVITEKGDISKKIIVK